MERLEKISKLSVSDFKKELPVELILEAKIISYATRGKEV